MPGREVSCPFISPEIGITPTPAIDLQSGTLYVLARTKESRGALSADRYLQKLHALAITTGAEKFGGPVEIKASVKGTGVGGTGDVAFDAGRELPRAALLLSGGQVYLTLGLFLRRGTLSRLGDGVRRTYAGADRGVQYLAGRGGERDLAER